MAAAAAEQGPHLELLRRRVGVAVRGVEHEFYAEAALAHADDAAHHLEQVHVLLAVVGRDAVEEPQVPRPARRRRRRRRRRERRLGVVAVVLREQGARLRAALHGRRGARAAAGERRRRGDGAREARERGGAAPPRFGQLHRELIKNPWRVALLTFLIR